MADIKFAGDYNLEKATLTSYNGNEVDVIELIHSIKVYEDVYAPFITIDILIEDQIGLYHKLPILGEEILTLSLTSTDGEYGFKEALFSLYKTKDMIEKGQRGFIYTISFISVEAIKDLNLKLSKSFKGTATSIANDLLKKEGLQTPKEVYLEETSGNLSYISNYWPPIKNFKYLSQRAVSATTKSPSFVFFENKFGFYFTSLATLKGQEPIASLFYSANVNDDLANSLQRVEKLYIDRGIDYIQRIQNGALGSNVIYTDPTFKSYFYKYLDFLSSYENQPRLNETPFASTEATRRVNGRFSLNTTPSYTKTGMNDEHSERWFQERLAELGAIRAFEIQVDLPGSMHIAVGQTTDFYMYSGDVPKDNDLSSTLDPMFSGRYLITSICHTFSRERHTMTMGLSKDSITKKVITK